VRVSELEKGMLVAPSGDNEVFLKVPPSSTSRELGYITVRIIPHRSLRRKHGEYGNKISKSWAMYLGTREDLNLEQKDMPWINRYVMIDNEILAVDPSAWRRLKKVSK
jgi:hypothetical protein